MLYFILGFISGGAFAIVILLTYMHFKIKKIGTDISKIQEKALSDFFDTM